MQDLTIHNMCYQTLDMGADSSPTKQASSLPALRL